MNEGLFGALALTAATVGSLHSIAPDHWVPFAAVARARGWSAARTARVTLLCGFGHVTVSAALHDYLITGAGSISGPGGLAKQGAGKLSLAISNNYMGSTIISGGTIVLKAKGGIPGGSGQSLYERMRQWNVRHGFDFLHLENTQICLPLMEPI